MIAGADIAADDAMIAVDMALSFVSVWVAPRPRLW
jgi:hypothetical protein